MYIPDEIIVAKDAKNHPVTCSILDKCPGVPVRIDDSNQPDVIRKASQILSNSDSLAETICLVKHVLAVVSTIDVIKQFDMPDSRIGCPHFMKLVMASNGCHFNCAWCYMKLTYRDRWPFIFIRVSYDQIKKKIRRYLSDRSALIIIFNMGELQDGLALEHLTGAAQVLIPFFGQLSNGRLFLLTKSDNVESILDLAHNGHTILAWSLNAPEVSAEFELDTPSFERRLGAAERAQKAGYPIRLRLDPIVPVPRWQKMYGDTIKRIFDKVTPERVTLGTLRFEEEFYEKRYSIVGRKPSGRRLLAEMDKMEPMLPPMLIPMGKRDKKGRPQMKESIGKYSYPEDLRLEVFRFAISEIRKYFDGPIALCKELPRLWPMVGLDPRHCRCVCQFDEANLLNSNESVHTGTHLPRNKTLV